MKNEFLASLGISEAEKRVIQHYLEGLEPKEIGTVLGLTDSSVYNHMESVRHKIEVKKSMNILTKYIEFLEEKCHERS